MEIHKRANRNAFKVDLAQAERSCREVGKLESHIHRTWSTYGLAFSNEPSERQRLSICVSTVVRSIPLFRVDICTYFITL